MESWARQLTTILKRSQRAGCKPAPVFAGDAPIKLFVVKSAVVRRQGEVVRRSQSKAFAIDWELNQDVSLRGEAIEQAPFEITLEGCQGEFKNLPGGPRVRFEVAAAVPRKKFAGGEAAGVLVIGRHFNDFGSVTAG